MDQWMTISWKNHSLKFPATDLWKLGWKHIMFLAQPSPHSLGVITALHVFSRKDQLGQEWGCRSVPGTSRFWVWGEQRMPTSERGSQMGQKKPRGRVCPGQAQAHCCAPEVLPACVQGCRVRCLQMALECSSMSSTCSQESLLMLWVKRKLSSMKCPQKAPSGRKCHWEVSLAPLLAERPVSMNLHDLEVSLKGSSFHFPTCKCGTLASFQAYAIVTGPSSRVSSWGKEFHQLIIPSGWFLKMGNWGPNVSEKICEIDTWGLHLVPS